MTSQTPSRCDVWLVDLDPTRGHEQAGRRPAVVVSEDNLNHGAAGLSIGVPMTTRRRPVPFHVVIPAGLGGLTQDSFAKCEEVRVLSHERFIRRLGSLPPGVMEDIEDKLRVLMHL